MSRTPGEPCGSLTPEAGTDLLLQWAAAAVEAEAAAVAGLVLLQPWRAILRRRLALLH
jgi:hypothetical protein